MLSLSREILIDGNVAPYLDEQKKREEKYALPIAHHVHAHTHIYTHSRVYRCEGKKSVALFLHDRFYRGFYGQRERDFFTPPPALINGFV